MMEKNKGYYDNEALLYSEKRYPELVIDYNQYFFKKRLSLLLRLIQKIESKTSAIIGNLLEIGCADGVVLGQIAEQFPSIQHLVGIDVSEKMIDVARSKNEHSRCEYFVRAGKLNQRFDLIIEVGVLNLLDFETELDFVYEHLEFGKYYICSLASKNSLRSRLKFNKNQDGFDNLLSFTEYEKILEKRFIIEAETAYGLFIPYIWRIPMLARVVQAVAEYMFSKLFADLFHEKIYVLRKRI